MPKAQLVSILAILCLALESWSLPFPSFDVYNATSQTFDNGSHQGMPFPWSRCFGLGHGYPHMETDTCEGVITSLQAGRYSHRYFTVHGTDRNFVWSNIHETHVKVHCFVSIEPTTSQIEDQFTHFQISVQAKEILSLCRDEGYGGYHNIGSQGFLLRVAGTPPTNFLLVGFGFNTTAGAMGDTIYNIQPNGTSGDRTEVQSWDDPTISTS